MKLFGEIRDPHGIIISKSGDVIAAEQCVGGEVVVFKKLGERVKAIKHASVKNPRGVTTVISMCLALYQRQYSSLVNTDGLCLCKPRSRAREALRLAL